MLIEEEKEPLEFDPRLLKSVVEIEIERFSKDEEKYEFLKSQIDKFRCLSRISFIEDSYYLSG